MFSILLQVMDHATLTDSHGRKADFRHVILIMTTNAGARDVSDRRLGFADAGTGGSTRGALERTFTPEFRNRLDATVTFNALGTTEVEKVVDKQIDELRGMVAAKRITIELDPAARAWLAAKGFDRAFGARPMARLDRARDQEAALGVAALRVAGRRRRVAGGGGGRRAAAAARRRGHRSGRRMSLRSLRREYRGQPLVEGAAADDPFEQFAPLVRARARDRARRDGHDARHGHARRPAVGAHGAAQGLRRARIRVLHQLREPQGRGTGKHAAGGAAVLLAHVRTSGTHRGRGVARAGGGIGRATSRAGRSRAGGARSRRRRAGHRAPRGARGGRSRASAPQHGEAVPRPPFWGGYRVSPDAFEFWQGRENRLHDRLAYVLAEGVWTRRRLAP